MIIKAIEILITSIILSIAIIVIAASLNEAIKIFKNKKK